ncbi:hypothetical protein SLS64_001201 [Diaporthe eres]
MLSLLTWALFEALEISKDNIDAFTGIDDTVFVAYIGLDDHAARETFAEVAKRYREEFTFGVVSDATLTKGEASVSPSVKCYLKDGGTVTRTATSFTDTAALERFVIEASRPVVGELTKYNQQRLLNGYYDSLTCVTVDPLEFPELQEKMGLEHGGFPSGAVHQLSTDRIYPYPRNLPVDSQSLQKWGLDVWQGRIKPWTPPGAATAPDDPGPTKRAKRKVSLANIPGVTIKVAGHDEL